MTTSTSSEQLDPRDEHDALVWQARAQVDIGVLIEKYLTEHPAPVLAAHAGLYRRWAQELVAAGEARMEDLEPRAAVDS